MGAAARTRSPSARYAAATPTAPRGPQRAEGPGAFRIPAGTVQLRHLRAAAMGDLHPDKTVPRADRDRDRPARSPRPAMPDTSAEQLAYQQGGVSPVRVTGTEHPADERAGDPHPLRPPGHRHALPDLRPSHPRTRLPRPPGPGKSPGPAGRMYGNARSTQRLTSSRNTRPAQPRPWPSVESRRCTPTVLAAGRRPLYVRGRRDTGTYSATR